MWGIDSAKTFKELATVTSLAIKRLFNSINTLDNRVTTLELPLVPVETLSTIRNITSASSVLTTDSIVICSGASFILTLPTAVGVTGKIYTIVHNGTNLTQVYTLNTTSSQTIGGVASGDYKLHTNQEILKLTSDGTNWVILSHFAETPWVDAGAITITASTTNPTKATSRSIDKIWWKRQGKDVHINMQYRQNATTGAAAGTGVYIFSMPSNILIDTTITGASTNSNISGLDTQWGSALTGNDTVKRPSAIKVRTASSFIIYGYSTGSNSYLFIGNTFFPTNDSAGMSYSANFVVPVQSWQP